MEIFGNVSSNLKHGDLRKLCKIPSKILSKSYKENLRNFGKV